MTTPPPLRVLLIGHGKFGREHRIVWQQLAQEGLATLAGIVVQTETSRRALAATTDIPIHTSLAAIDFAQIDAVDIVTPSETHAALVRQLLPHAHVLVEKPLATTAEEAASLAAFAEASPNILAVAHIYRFHPLITALREQVAATAERPQVIFGTMLNPASEAPPNADPCLEMLHHFDLIDMLFGVAPTVCIGERQDNVATVSLSYPNPGAAPTNATLRLGWEGTSRERTIELLYPTHSLQADLIDQTITIDRATSMRRIILPHGHAALAAQLRDFATTIQANAPPTTNAPTAARIVAIATRARPARLNRRPKIAVMGGGIFGATAAAELGDFCDVTLIERHDTLLAEASTLNQWRYHHGFHYPRSLEMIHEIQECRDAFEEVYSDAIVADLASYYATARTAQVITGERYLHACTAMGLAFTQEMPPAGVLDPAQISLCLRTGEGVFNADAMRAIMLRRLGAHPAITLALNHEVTGGNLLPDGRKRLLMRNGPRLVDEAFDYVVNATYVNRNLMCQLFGFPIEALRFDLLELLLLELDLPRMSITVLDGPFTSLVSTGRDNQFTLSHIQHSLLATATPANGKPPTWDAWPSNRENIMRTARHYLPGLRDARYIGSRYGTRVVNARPQDVDGRPTVVVDHGFGCWSILGGKVNTSVTNARQIAAQIARQQDIDRPAAPTTTGRIASAGELWRDSSPFGARRR